MLGYHSEEVNVMLQLGDERLFQEQSSLGANSGRQKEIVTGIQGSPLVRRESVSLGIQV